MFLKSLMVLLFLLLLNIPIIVSYIVNTQNDSDLLAWDEAFLVANRIARLGANQLAAGYHDVSDLFGSSFGGGSSNVLVFHADTVEFISGRGMFAVIKSSSRKETAFVLLRLSDEAYSMWGKPLDAFDKSIYSDFFVSSSKRTLHKVDWDHLSLSE
ncbi:hypothetical protein MLD52_18340 [Puniceicoccaceae bacterium K14]|nr:hypothetical protein [Puniceicoccaceae bacterium K14]